VFDPTLEEICRFGREEFVEPILELSVFVEGNSSQTVGERAKEMIIRWGKVRRVGRMWKNLPVEFLSGRFRHVCSVWSGVVTLKNYSMSSSREFLLDCFLQTAKLLTIAFSSDGQVSLKRFIMDTPLHIPQDAASSVECHACQNCLSSRAQTFLCYSFSNRVFSTDGTNVSGGLCSFGASIVLVKKKVSEMFIFLNLTLHSFGPENFVPLVQIGKLKNFLIEENERYNMVYYI
jgi:hypothetical protein